jgi:hypothetical protein
MATARQGVSNDVLAATLDVLKEDITDIKGTMKLMTDAVSKLTAVEQRQSDQSERIADAYALIAAHAVRIGSIEVAMPGLKELRRWVVAGMVAGIAMMFVSVTSLVLKPHYPEPNTYILERGASSPQSLRELKSMPSIPQQAFPAITP